jgi:hypothetical protein
LAGIARFERGFGFTKWCEIIHSGILGLRRWGLGVGSAAARISLPWRETFELMNGMRYTKPTRRKRVAVRFAALVVAVSALGAAYWFTRPPELVWWRSNEVGDPSIHAKLLIPQGWKALTLHTETAAGTKGWYAIFEVRPLDQTPSMLRWLGFHMKEQAWLSVVVGRSSTGRWSQEPGNAVHRADNPGSHSAYQYFSTEHHNSFGMVTYSRSNLAAFNCTYRQICNSLRIE